ncbi:hydrogenase maturation nickel metallochaperone HypA [Halosimplex carlsbadense]|uniref:hydrogenase maturation nickel metallochaperone HypA n=1 Tax=Halosimplex carlsbadense TaxID=171164 RepID=UPI0013784FC6|nr:hydrogenase maturation nickel metallochaperone HypA [Halosimplex carlsbadense]
MTKRTRTGPLESVHASTERAVEAVTTPGADGECPQCGLEVPEQGPPMCPRCGAPR